jgi:hypothetical protein
MFWHMCVFLLLVLRLTLTEDTKEHANANCIVNRYCRVSNGTCIMDIYFGTANSLSSNSYVAVVTSTSHISLQYDRPPPPLLFILPTASVFDEATPEEDEAIGAVYKWRSASSASGHHHPPPPLLLLLPSSWVVSWRRSKAGKVRRPPKKGRVG